MSASVARSVRWLVGFGLAIVVTVGVSGCFTGDRPTLADGPVMTGDPNVDAVLERLDQAPQAVFSADYEVLTRFGDVTRPASVVQAGPARRSITGGSIRFLVEDSATATCDQCASACARPARASEERRSGSRRSAAARSPRSSALAPSM